MHGFAIRFALTARGVAGDSGAATCASAWVRVVLSFSSSGETVVGAESMRPILLYQQDLRVCVWGLRRYQRTATPGARITGVPFRDGPAVWATVLVL